jgi:hypothetical protein
MTMIPQDQPFDCGGARALRRIERRSGEHEQSERGEHSKIMQRRATRRPARKTSAFRIFAMDGHAEL